LAMSRSKPRNVAVVGAGIAGAELVRKALPGPHEITLIEPKGQIECQALYPEYLVGSVSLADLTAPLNPFCDRVGAKHVKERALRLEDDAVICDRSRVEFDIAVIATGAIQNYFGIKGADKAFTVNTLDGVVRAREFLDSKKPGRITIIGAGLTGIETACVLKEKIDAQIGILEAKDRILPQFSAKISPYLEKELARRGIDFLVSRRVQEVGESSILLMDGSTMPCDMAIWTAGIKPPEFIQSLPFAKKDDEWIRTDDCLRAKENMHASEKVFVLGDSAWVEIGGRVASKTAIEAERQAGHMAGNLIRLAEGKPLQSYSTIAPTNAQVALISLGCNRAMGVYGDRCLTLPSRLLHSLKSWIDKSFIERFK
jgi:NADH dehydrogenase